MARTKFKIGDLVVFTGAEGPKLDEHDFGAYFMLVSEYHRPAFLEEKNNAGIVLKIYLSSQVFLKQNKEHNMYVWRSQVTEKQYIIFQHELTKIEEHVSVDNYQNSFLTDRFKKNSNKR